MKRQTRKQRKVAVRFMARHQGVTIARHKALKAGKPAGLAALMAATLKALGA